MYKITNTLTKIQVEQLYLLYQTEWWSCKRTMNDVQKIIKHSSLLFAVTDKYDQLIGFSRVLTDYCYFAYIYDVIVKKTHRNHGIGDLLMQTIFEHPELKSMTSIELVCRKDMVDFYQKYGFSHDYGASVAMRRKLTNSDF